MKVGPAILPSPRAVVLWRCSDPARQQDLLLSGRTFPACNEVGLSSTDEVLEDDAERSGLTLMGDYKKHGATIMAFSSVSVLALQKKNAKYLPADLVFDWDEVDVFKWRYPLTDVQAEYRVGRVLVDQVLVRSSSLEASTTMTQAMTQ